jgi:hypothetical protein
LWVNINAVVSTIPVAPASRLSLAAASGLWIALVCPGVTGDLAGGAAVSAHSARLI